MEDLSCRAGVRERTLVLTVKAPFFQMLPGFGANPLVYYFCKSSMTTVMEQAESAMQRARFSPAAATIPP